MLDEGKNVVFITLGCPTVYATCIYVHKLVLKAGYDAELVAGVTSICAVAAKLNVSLCERAEPLIVLPGSYKEASKFLDGPGNKVLMKSASEIARVRDELKERGLLRMQPWLNAVVYREKKCTVILMRLILTAAIFL